MSAEQVAIPGVSVAHAATGCLLDLCELGPRLLDYDVMTPDVWADYNQIDDDGRVLVYLEDIVRAERVVVGATVIVADPEAKAPHGGRAGVLAERDRFPRRRLVQPPHLNPGGLGYDRLSGMDSPQVDIAVDCVDVANDGWLWTRFTDIGSGFVPVAAVRGDRL